MTLPCWPCEHSPFDRFEEVLLPHGGMVAVLVEAYFDESAGLASAVQPDGTQAKCAILCVAGYLIESGRRKLFDQDWNEVLRWKDLPYFHMVDCAHGNGPFANLTKPDRIQVAARMIAAIKRHTIKGFAITVNVAQYNLFMPKRHELAGAPYSFCAHGVIGGICNWADEQNYWGKIAYFYEAGHISQGEAGRLMEKLFKVPGLKEKTRYAGHAFVEKTQAPCVQAADLLAWQFYTDIRRQMERRGPALHRKDFESFLTHPHEATYVSPWIMTKIAKGLGYDTSEAEELLRSHFGSEYPDTGVIDVAAMNAFWQPS